jgi:hypothetical protein
MLHPTCIYWSNYYYLLFLTVLDMLHLLQGFVSNALFQFAIVMVARSKRFVPFCNSEKKSRLFHKHGPFGTNSNQSLFYIGVELTNNEFVFFQSIYWLPIFDWSWLGLKEARGKMSTEAETLADALVKISGHQEKHWSICRCLQTASLMPIMYQSLFKSEYWQPMYQSLFWPISIFSALKGPYLLLLLHSSQCKLHV